VGFIVHLLVHIHNRVAVKIGQRADVVGHLLGDKIIVFLLLGTHYRGKIKHHATNYGGLSLVGGPGMLYRQPPVRPMLAPEYSAGFGFQKSSGRNRAS
jgi:hypothetical protein